MNEMLNQFSTYAPYAGDSSVTGNDGMWVIAIVVLVALLFKFRK